MLGKTIAALSKTIAPLSEKQSLAKRNNLNLSMASHAMAIVVLSQVRRRPMESAGLAQSGRE
ncbi:hypothetical protein SAMN06265222_11329 [Neorhodopirellula lusitana]|uniref:Uncharacterized protein n=1 Tax=Neorhodopirellula lusitana TaxID=445327 RepID=A0ABY1QG69_9BACT|nr:hypothetical protein SAMN06265222_11329 [Neorhodopirellula lusitana]